MIKEYKCTCGEINPKNFYIGQKSTCKKCRSKINKEKYTPTEKLSLLEKFTQGYVVNKNTDCWLWNKTTTEQGYGQFMYNYTLYIAHRVAYEFFNDKIPKDMIVRHSCNTKNCVNPEHLYLEEQQQDLFRDFGKTAK